MSLILRLRHGLSYTLYKNQISYPLSSIREYGQLARKEDDEEVEYDQRRLPADYDPATFDPTQHRSPPTERVWRLVDEITSLTLIEAGQLTKIIMEKKGMKEKPVIGMMKPGTGAAAMAGMAVKSGSGAAVKEEKKPEKSVFEIKLESFDAASKIKIIKEVRSCTELGLKEAKALVEKAPTVIKSGVSKEEGEKIIEKMIAAGAKVVLE